MNFIRNFINQYEFKILYKKIAFTCLILTIYLLGSKIPLLPATMKYKNPHSLSVLVSSSMGGDFQNLNMFTLGLGPWLTAMIIITLVSYRNIDKFRKQTRKQKHYKEKFLALGLSVVQSFYLIHHLFSENKLPYEKAGLLILILVTGAMLLMWLADRNVQYGLGGAMPIVLMGIIKSMIQQKNLSLDGSTLMIILIVAVLLVSFTMLMMMELVEYRTPYIDIMNISKQYNQTYLSWKVNPAGSISIMICLSAFTLFNNLIILLGDAFLDGVFHSTNMLTLRHPLGITIYAVLQFISSYVLSRFLLNTSGKAEEFQKTGNFFEHRRPGKLTEQYLNSMARRTCFLGAVLLTCIMTVPLILGIIYPKFAQEFRFTVQLIILVYIALNITETIKAFLYFDQYKSFIKKYW